MNFLQGFWNDLTLEWNIALRLSLRGNIQDSLHALRVNPVLAYGFRPQIGIHRYEFQIDVCFVSEQQDKGNN